MCGILVIVGRREVKSKVCCAVVSWVAHLMHIEWLTVYVYKYSGDRITCQKSHSERGETRAPCLAHPSSVRSSDSHLRILKYSCSYPTCTQKVFFTTTTLQSSTLCCMFACPSFRTLITGIRWYDFTIFFFVTHEFSKHTCCCMFPKTELWLKHFIYFRVLIYIRLSSLYYIMDRLNRTKRPVQNRDMPEAQSGRLIITLHELRVPVVCTCVDCDCYSSERPYRQSL